MVLVDVQQTVAVLCSRVCGVLTYVVGVSHDCCTVSKVFSILCDREGMRICLVDGDVVDFAKVNVDSQA